MTIKPNRFGLQGEKPTENKQLDNRGSSVAPQDRNVLYVSLVMIAFIYLLHAGSGRRGRQSAPS
jgi:hypothetical protein